MLQEKKTTELTQAILEKEMRIIPFLIQLFLFFHYFFISFNIKNMNVHH